MTSAMSAMSAIFLWTQWKHTGSLRVYGDVEVVLPKPSPSVWVTYIHKLFADTFVENKPNRQFALTCVSAYTLSWKAAKMLESVSHKGKLDMDLTERHTFLFGKLIEKRPVGKIFLEDSKTLSLRFSLLFHLVQDLRLGVVFHKVWMTLDSVAVPELLARIHLKNSAQKNFKKYYMNIIISGYVSKFVYFSRYNYNSIFLEINILIHVDIAASFSVLDTNMLYNNFYQTRPRSPYGAMVVATPKMEEFAHFMATYLCFTKTSIRWFYAITKKTECVQMLTKWVPRTLQVFDGPDKYARKIVVQFLKNTYYFTSTGFQMTMLESYVKRRTLYYVKSKPLSLAKWLHINQSLVVKYSTFGCKGKSVCLLNITTATKHSLNLTIKTFKFSSESSNVHCSLAGIAAYDKDHHEIYSSCMSHQGFYKHRPFYSRKSPIYLSLYSYNTYGQMHLELHLSSTQCVVVRVMSCLYDYIQFGRCRKQTCIGFMDPEQSSPESFHPLGEEKYDWMQHMKSNSCLVLQLSNDYNATLEKNRYNYYCPKEVEAAKFVHFRMMSYTEGSCLLWGFSSHIDELVCCLLRAVSLKIIIFRIG